MSAEAAQIAHLIDRATEILLGAGAPPPGDPPLPCPRCEAPLDIYQPLLRVPMVIHGGCERCKKFYRLAERPVGSGNWVIKGRYVLVSVA